MPNDIEAEHDTPSAEAGASELDTGPGLEQDDQEIVTDQPAIVLADDQDSEQISRGGSDLETTEEKEEKKRRRLFFLLLLLLLLLCCIGAMLCRYINQPEPLPELLPIDVELTYPPHYLFSIYGMDRPVGVAISPDARRLYVSETGGERLVRIFDREGEPLGSFAPPRTSPGERSPVYLDVDRFGRVFVADRLQHAIYVYDGDGNYLDTILAPDLTLHEYVAKHAQDIQPGFRAYYNVFGQDVLYQNPGTEIEQKLPPPDIYTWAPLGVDFDSGGNLLLTDVDADRNAVREIPADVIGVQTWDDYDPPLLIFGESGQGNDQFLFPNAAVRDSHGRIHVTDGNNSRVSTWSADRQFLFFFGRGTSEGALSLPRGAAVDGRDRLHVVDAVGQNVKVYDVSGQEPVFLFTFGVWGKDDGQFDYPNDIALDASGRLYIADRENNRVQVWSY